MWLHLLRLWNQTHLLSLCPIYTSPVSPFGSTAPVLCQSAQPLTSASVDIDLRSLCSMCGRQHGLGVRPGERRSPSVPGDALHPVAHQGEQQATLTERKTSRRGTPGTPVSDNSTKNMWSSKKHANNSSSCRFRRGNEPCWAA